MHIQNCKLDIILLARAVYKDSDALLFTLFHRSIVSCSYKDDCRELKTNIMHFKLFPLKNEETTF